MPHPVPIRPQRSRPFWLCVALACCLAGCAQGASLPLPAPTPAPATVYLHMDAADQVLQTEAPTVRLALRDWGLHLEATDEVTPPLWTPVRSGMAITITRYLEEREEEVLPAGMRTVRDEFLSPEEGRVVQAPEDGLEEFIYRAAYDGPHRLGRELVARRVVVPPREGLELVGAKGTIPSAPISGTLAYISNSDAWVMRGESGHKRPLTRDGLLDGRVFDLSPDGRTLLFTQTPTRTDAAFNELWTMDAEVLNARPQPTGIAGVLWAAWAPGRGSADASGDLGAGLRFAYTSAEPTRGAPGWRARNDLRLVAWPALTETLVLSPTSAFIYSWWGETWAWSPDGRALAYARADELGLLRLERGEREPLQRFRPYHTGGDWVWLPQIAWAPDGGQLAANLHTGAEEEALFSVMLLDLEGGVRELAPDAGPWAAPAWSPRGDRIVLGLPQPGAEAGAYLLHQIATAVWAPPAPLLPEGAIAVPYLDLAWGPDGDQLVVRQDGDLQLVHLSDGRVAPLTATGLASHPRWR